MTANAQLDGRVEFPGTMAQAVVANPSANAFPNGTLIMCSDGVMFTNKTANTYYGFTPLGIGASANASLSRQVPLTGASIQVAAGVYTLVLNPAGTLAALTVVFPQAPVDNQNFLLTSSQIVTALTLTPGAGSTINAAATSLAANVAIEYRFVLADLKWYRVI